MRKDLIALNELSMKIDIFILFIFINSGVSHNEILANDKYIVFVLLKIV